MDIFDRGQEFYTLWQKSKYFSFPESLYISDTDIVYENIDMSKYVSGYVIELSRNDIIQLAKTLWEFYFMISNQDRINIFSQQKLHGDLHLWNIFFPLEKKEKLLFIDPETPNSLDYDEFTHNTICFEISYLLYHLDNHFPIWNTRFYSNNFNFKKIFLYNFCESIWVENSEFLQEIKKHYKKHIYRKFEFHYNPVLLLHRFFRFCIIFSKYIIWISYLKYSKKLSQKN